MEVFTYGNMDFLFEVFSAVKGVMGDGSFSTLIRLTIVLGFLLLAYQLFFSLKIDVVATGLIKQYIAVIVVFYALFVPKTDVIIRDEIQNTQVTVNSVPFGTGLVGHLFTSVEKGITDLVETYFTTPDDMKYTSSGYAFSAMVIDNLKYATPLNPYFKRTFNGYVVDCFFTDVLWGDKDLGAVVSSNNIIALMNPQHSASMAARLYDSTSPQGAYMTCTQVYNYLVSNLDAQANGGLSQLNTLMRIDVTSKLPVVSSSVLGVAASAIDLTKQSMAANALKEGLAQTSMYAGVSADAVMYATALASQQQRSSWTVGGELSKKYIPIMRQILEAMVYGMFPIIFILMMTPMVFRALRMYFTLLVWLLMWAPLYAILNLIVNTRTTGVLATVSGQFSLGTMPFIYESTNDLVAMAGYMSWLVPTLAFAIAKGSEHAMVHMASGIAGSTSLTQHHAGAAITGPEGAAKSSAASAHFAAANAFGATAVAAGGAANAYHGMMTGMAWGNQGGMSMLRTARTNVDSSVGGASGTRMAADANKQTVEEMKAKQSEVGESRRYNDAVAFEGVARDMGVTTEGLARAFATKSHAQLGAVIGNYASRNGISYGEAAQRIGSLFGSRESLSGQAFEKSTGVTGDGGFLRTEANKLLNEAARFEQAYQFARGAGFAGSRDDFAGMYESHGARHAQESWTLDERRAGWLSGVTGMNFQAGDRVGLARDPETGEISLAKAEAGASRDTFHIARHTEGQHAAMAVGGEKWNAIKDELRANNHHNAADMMGDMEKNMSRYGLGEGAFVDVWRTNEGGLASLNVTHGARAFHYDTGSRQWGVEMEYGRSITDKNFSGEVDGHKFTGVMTSYGQSGEYSTFQGLVETPNGQRYNALATFEGGRVKSLVDLDAGRGMSLSTRDIDETRMSHGTVFTSPQTLLQMAYQGDSAAVRSVSRAETTPQRDSQIKNLSGQLSESLDEYVKMEGHDLTTAVAQAYAGAGISTPPWIVSARAGFEGRLGAESKNLSKYDLLTKSFDGVLTSAVKDADDQNLTGLARDTYISGKVQGFTQSLFEEIDEKNGFGTGKIGDLLSKGKDLKGGGEEGKREYPNPELLF